MKGLTREQIADHIAHHAQVARERAQVVGVMAAHMGEQFNPRRFHDAELQDIYARAYREQEAQE